MVDKVRRALAEHRVCLLLFALALVLYAWCAAHTRPIDFAMDVEGHLNYIMFMREKGWPPRPDGGWVFYHPPLYYALNAWLAEVFTVSVGLNSIQVYRGFSVLLYVVYLGFGFSALRLFLQRGMAFYTAWALLLFWPIGLVIASRIDGNLLLYPLMAATFYYLCRWQREKTPKFLAYALFATGLGLLTRNTALVLLALIGLAVAIEWARRRITLRELLRRGVVLGAVFCVAAGAYNVQRMWNPQRGALEVVGNAWVHFGGPLEVKNSAWNLMGFDMGKYVSPPFLNSRNPATGIDYFWIGFLKSALWGEFRWGGSRLMALPNIMLLGMIVYTALAWCWLRPAAPATPTLLMPALMLGILVVASFAARLRYPFSCTQDFRYIYPALIPAAIFYAHAMERYRAAGYGWLVKTGLLMAGGVVIFGAMIVTRKIVFLSPVMPGN